MHIERKRKNTKSSFYLFLRVKERGAMKTVAEEVWGIKLECPSQFHSYKRGCIQNKLYSQLQKYSRRFKVSVYMKINQKPLI